MRNQDTTSSIVKSAKHFFSGTLISRCSGLAREVVMALLFGVNPAVAAFWMAFRFAHLLRRLFGEGALNAAFVPHFEALRQEDSVKGARFFYDLATTVTLVLLALSFLGEGILGGVLLFAPCSEGNREVIKLTMIMLPALVFISLYALNCALLNCDKKYFLPSFAPTLLNLIWLAALFALWKKPVVEAMHYLAMVIVLAFMFQWVVTLPSVYRYLARNLGRGFQGSGFSAKEILKILKPFALGLIGVAATQVNSALDAIFARAADPEGPAYLWYALRLQQLPLALMGLGLTGALLPPIARSFQKNQTNHYLSFIHYGFNTAVLILLPVTGAIFALGFSSINLVYGHGAFSEAALVSTTLSLWAYGLALLPMTLVLILAGAFYAKKNYTVPTLLALTSVALNVGLNALLVYIFQMGAVSIALATALSSLFNALGLSLFLKKEGFQFSQALSMGSRTLLATLLATSLTVWAGHHFFAGNTLICLRWRALSTFPTALIPQLTVLSLEALIFAATFVLAAYLLRIKGLFLLLRRPAT